MIFLLVFYVNLVPYLYDNLTIILLICIEIELFSLKLKNREKDFSQFSELKIFIGSWNVGGFHPNLNFDFKKDFFDFDNESPDLIVIGLQEIVDLNAKNVVAASNEKIMKIWETVISSNLRWKGDYIFITSKSLVGVFIMLYAKSYLKNRISKVETDIVKCGVMNKLGNKGATILRIRIDDTALCFLNCHLEAGNKKVNERLENINDIHTKAFQQEGIGKKKVFFVCFLTT